MPTEAPPARKIPWLKLVVVAVVVMVVGGLFLRGVNVRGYLDQGMAFVRSASPATFFICMALLPAVGAPMLGFMLPAGPLWGEKLGMPTVVGLACVAITVNFTLTYLLARYALRPLLTKLVLRLGYKLPQVEDGDVSSLIVIMRVTQGIPFFVQNYLLGLAEVPAGRYFLITAILALPQSTGWVLFGDALLHGRGKAILIVGGLLIALAAVTHVVRRHYGRKKKAA